MTRGKVSPLFFEIAGVAHDLQGVIVAIASPEASGAGTSAPAMVLPLEQDAGGEYPTDLVFRSEATVQPLYERLSRDQVLAVKADQVASFLMKITPLLAQELGSRFATKRGSSGIEYLDAMINSAKTR